MTSTQAAYTQKGNFVLLKAGDLRLLLAQSEVGTTQYLPATPLQPSGQPGLFELAPEDASEVLYVAALSAKMDLLPELPPGRFLMTSFLDQAGIALCWEEVRVLIDTEIAIHTLPPAMVSSHSPFTEYVEFGEEIAFCCSAQGLFAHAFPVEN